MSRPTKVPSYRKHSQSTQAVVTLNTPGGRKDVLLGVYGSLNSHVEYARVIAEWAGTVSSSRSGDSGSQLTINELVLLFWRYAESYFQKADGKPTSEIHNYRAVIRDLRQIYGHTRAGDFGPIALKTLRATWVVRGLVRTQINNRIGRIRRIFIWATEEQLLSPDVFQSLRAVRGLQKGRSDARESEPIMPVTDVEIEKTLPFLSPTIRAMVQVQLLTGMRPGELCSIRWGDIDSSGEIWNYRPRTHKTEHRGKGRIIPIGPRAQALLEEFRSSDPDAYAFSPIEAEAQRLSERTAARRTPRYPSHLQRNLAKRKTKPRGKPGESYTVAAYRRAIDRACQKAWPLPEHLARKLTLTPEGDRVMESDAAWKVRLGAEGQAEVKCWHRKFRWFPHQLRHSAGTRIRQQYGIEAARTVLGHSELATTEIYAERDASLASKVAAEIG